MDGEDRSACLLLVDTEEVVAKRVRDSGPVTRSNEIPPVPGKAALYITSAIFKTAVPTPAFSEEIG